MSVIFKFTCRPCGQHISTERSHVNGRFECPTCAQPIIIPRPQSIGKSQPARQTLRRTAR